MAVTGWQTSPAFNTSVGGVNIQEGMDPGDVNNAIRAMMAEIAAVIGSAGIGYITGQGGAVTQATSKSTGVTLNKLSGQITTNNASLASGAVVGFTVSNSFVAATDNIIINLQSGAASPASYRIWVESISAGNFFVVIENRSGGSLGEALVLNYSIIKAVAA